MRQEKYWECLKIGAVVALILSAAYLLGVFSTYQFRLHDPLYGGIEPLANFVILAIDDKSLQEIGRWPWDRKVFAELISKLKTAKVIGVDVVFSEPSNSESDALLGAAIRDSGKVILAVEYTSFEKNGDLISGRNPLVPVPELSGARRGIINLITDADGITRAANTRISGDYALFGEVIARSVVDVDVPRENHFLINMIGAKGSFKTVSISDVLSGKVDESIFNDAVVFIGATAPDLHDDHMAPTSSGVPVPGVEIQANIVQTILTKKYLHYQPRWTVVLAITAAALAVAVLIMLYNPWVVAAFCFFLLVGYLVLVVVLFSSGILVDMIFFPLAVILSYGSNLVHLYRAERRQKMQIIDAFGKYVSPEIVSELMQHPEKLTLGGERRELTIYFSDIRGFTTLSEKLSPEQLVALLNEYLTAMTDIIMSHRGIVDKYIGDAVMAFWGAPLPQKNHAVLACGAALEMMEKLKSLQPVWMKKGFPLVECGMGINTGNAVIGNMGSSQRFNYTCMGDTINLGSRLEGLTKEYGVGILISEATRRKLPKEFIVREVDTVKVKGKKEPIIIYELAGKVRIDAKKQKIISYFESGLKKYRSTKFKEAISDFEKSAQLGDKTSEIFIERCHHFIKEHPGNAWDCVWVMKTK